MMIIKLNIKLLCLYFLINQYISLTSSNESFNSKIQNISNTIENTTNNQINKIKSIGIILFDQQLNTMINYHNSKENLINLSKPTTETEMKKIIEESKSTQLIKDILHTSIRKILKIQEQNKKCLNDFLKTTSEQEIINSIQKQYNLIENETISKITTMKTKLLELWKEINKEFQNRAFFSKIEDIRSKIEELEKKITKKLKSKCQNIIDKQKQEINQYYSFTEKTSKVSKEKQHLKKLKMNELENSEQLLEINNILDQAYNNITTKKNAIFSILNVISQKIQENHTLLEASIIRDEDLLNALQKDFHDIEKKTLEEIEIIEKKSSILWIKTEQKEELEIELLKSSIINDEKTEKLENIVLISEFGTTIKKEFSKIESITLEIEKILNNKKKEIIDNNNKRDELELSALIKLMNQLTENALNDVAEKKKAAFKFFTFIVKFQKKESFPLNNDYRAYQDKLLFLDIENKFSLIMKKTLKTMQEIIDQQPKLWKEIKLPKPSIEEEKRNEIIHNLTKNVPLLSTGYIHLLTHITNKYKHNLRKSYSRKSYSRK